MQIEEKILKEEKTTVKNLPARQKSFLSQATLEAWSEVFRMSGFLFFIAGIIFVVFGSSDPQKWDDGHDDEDDQA